MEPLDRSAWEAIRADNARVAALHVALLDSLRTGLCPVCSAPFERDERPGVMPWRFTCQHGPVEQSELVPALTAKQRERLGLPL